MHSSTFHSNPTINGFQQMVYTPRLWRIRLLIRGLLVLLSASCVPTLASSEPDNPAERATGFQIGRYTFVSTGLFVYSPLINGFRVTLTSTTYGHDPAAGAYATIEATPEHPVVLQEIDGIMSVERH
jgi:hypothetical protein